MQTAKHGRKQAEGMEPKEKDMIEVMKQSADVHTVWVGEEDRIASFHAVDSYELQTFSCHDYFINFLRSLQERGFRFQ